MHTNEIIDWYFSTQMITELVLSALAKANMKRPIKNSIVYTDRGSQYISNIYSDTEELNYLIHVKEILIIMGL